MSIAAAVYALGQQLGLDDLTLNPDGLVSLELNQDDILHLEQAQDDLLIYRVLTKPHISVPSMLTALKACDQRQGVNTWMPQVSLIGLGGQAQLVCLFRVHSEQVSEQSVAYALDALEQFKREHIDPLGQ